MNIRRVLISVSDKAGLVEFAKALHERGVEIVSTGGTAKTLLDASVPVIQVSDVTGFPEILGGRVKTLHPKIFGGILADVSDDSHVEDLKKGDIQPIDMVVVNLYPFDLVQRQTRDEDVLIENIDIGGVALLRAAAKNHRNVVVVCDPEDYQKVISLLDSCGDVPLHDRRMLALKAFYHTMRYDATIHRVLSELFASERFEHLTFEKYSNPQLDYEVLDAIDEKFLSLSKLDDRVQGIALGALVTRLSDSLVVGANKHLIVSAVDMKESGGRLCDLVGEILVVRKLTCDLTRKIRESTFETVAFEEAEDEEYCREVLKGKELVNYSYVRTPSEVYLSFQTCNLVLREKIRLDDSSGRYGHLRLIARLVPLNAVVGKTDDGFSFVEIDPVAPANALRRLIEKLPGRLKSVTTNGPVDGIFKRLCTEHSVEII